MMMSGTRLVEKPRYSLCSYKLRTIAAKLLLMLLLMMIIDDDPELSKDNFRRQLKTFLFAQY